MLRVDQVAVDHDVEDAVVALDQLRLDVEVLLDPGRWTCTATDAAGRVAEATYDLFTSRPGRVLELVLE